MNWRDTIKLISITYTTNDMGNTIPNKTENEVFANRKSVRMQEFYQAAAHGLKPELMFEVRTHDYDGEDELEFDQKDYDIIRAYDKNGEITELICKAKAGS